MTVLKQVGYDAVYPGRRHYIVLFSVVHLKEKVARQGSVKNQHHPVQGDFPPPNRLGKHVNFFLWGRFFGL